MLTRSRVRTKEPCVKSTGSCEIKFTDLKTLEGKILANRSSIRQIRQCFPPPTFHAIRYTTARHFDLPTQWDRKLVHVHLAIDISLKTSGRNSQEQNFLYHREAVKFWRQLNTSVGASAWELWSPQAFPYISYVEAVV